MNNMSFKDYRIKKIDEVIKNLNKIRIFYKEEYPGCFIIDHAIGFITGLRTLELKEDFDKSHLGVINEFNKETKNETRKV